MTVQYTDKIASRGGFGSFFKLLMRWRGSVYKMVWQDMLVYIILYYLISFIYRFGLGDESRRWFEMLVMHCAKFKSLLPVSFVLGFFVSLVVSRWWGVYQSIPWPDTLAILATTHIQAMTVEGRMLREKILRYVNLTIALTFTSISPVVRKKMPSLHHFHAAGYLTDDELDALRQLEQQNGQHKTWVPVVWACDAVEKARLEGLTSDGGQRALITEILKLRGLCGSLMGYNSYNVPLVYTQVVTIAVYSFFFISILGEQFINPSMNISGFNLDLYFPLFALLQIFFYIGWLKVAEALLNPFGSDDHDFEFVPLLSRHQEMVVLLSEQSRLVLTSITPEADADKENPSIYYTDDSISPQL